MARRSTRGLVGYFEKALPEAGSASTQIID